MKLLSISTDRKIFENGSAVRARQIEYAKHCDEMHIIVFADKNFKEESIAPNCFVYPTRSKSHFLYPFDAIRLGRFVMKRGITNITCQDSSFTAMVGVALKKSFNVPLEIQIHTDIGSPYFARSFGNRIRKAMALSYIRKADTIRVVSSRIKTFLTGKLGITENKITVRPIVVETEEIARAAITVDLHKKYPQFSKITLMASRITEEKNISMAIEAWKDIRSHKSDIGLVIVGSGPLLESLESKVAKLGLQEVVKFESWVNRETLFSYYKSADVFLNTSFFEGYGMTLVEAKAAGLKTISTDVGIADEVGVTITPYDPRALAEIVLKTLS